MPGCQAIGLLVSELLVPQLLGYQVVIAEAGHNCGWLNVWLVELWRQAWLRVGHDYSVRSSRMACYNPHRYDPNYETSITAKSEPHG